MQSFRFESQNIFIIEKTVEFIGKMIAKYALLNSDRRKKLSGSSNIAKRFTISSALFLFTQARKRSLIMAL